MSQERELRLALVCYGGVSLAVYMHGITKELQKLARASMVLHSKTEFEGADTYLQRAEDLAHRETDSETVYYELLRLIQDRINLRVIVDVAAGASAGGINALMLSRAITHDLPLDAHRDMWLKYADIGELLDDRRRPKAWSKWFMHPAIERWSRTILRGLLTDEESREKMSLLVRSTWFRTPFSGATVTHRLLEAFEGMGRQRHAQASLIPTGHQFDCLISVTDLHGYSQTIPLNDPAPLNEREHRHLWRFSHATSRSGNTDSDLDWDNLPGLVSAARATSSYAGAFPPFRLKEMSKVLTQRNQAWPARTRFLNSNLKPVLTSDVDPEHCYFVDGGILNNKPIRAAIDALREKPAQRQVDRRLVYIEPAPEQFASQAPVNKPGFFSTIRAAVYDIPRHQPIMDQMDEIQAYGRRSRDIQHIIGATRASVGQIIGQLMTTSEVLPPVAGRVTTLRAKAQKLAEDDAGFAFTAYQQLRMSGLIDRLRDLIREQLSAAPMAGAPQFGIREHIRRWASAQAAFDNPELLTRLFEHGDVNFRRRRLRFVIRILNEQYRGHMTPEEARVLGESKQTIYQVLESIEEKVRLRFYGETFRQWVEVFLSRPDTVSLENLIEFLVDTLNLAELDETVDGVIADLCCEQCPLSLRKEVLNAYLGFPFFDIATLPLLPDQSQGELEPIQVNRISTEDAQSLKPSDGKSCLKGVELQNFGAFFSRAHRENDYLWGRLHAAERLVDIILSSVPETDSIDAMDIKRRLFNSILDSESAHLERSEDLIHTIRQQVDEL